MCYLKCMVSTNAFLLNCTLYATMPLKITQTKAALMRHKPELQM